MVGGFGMAVLFRSDRQAACWFVEGSLLRYQQRAFRANASTNRPGAEHHRIHHHGFPAGPVEGFVLPVTKGGVSSTPGLDVNA